jgi:glycosyltransferase involved in cell wall biosynthesis
MNVVFITDIDSPHMVRFAEEMNKICNFQMLFLEDSSSNRDPHWKIDNPNNVVHLKSTMFVNTKILAKRFYVPFLSKVLERYDPDVIICSGFSKFVTFQSYLYSLINKTKFYVFTERSRDNNGLIRKKNIFWTIISNIFKNIDGILVTAEDIVDQFINFGFKKNKIKVCYYPTDIVPILNTSIKKNNSEINIIFPNRLTEIYNPLFSLKLAETILKDFKNVNFFFNKSGDLYEKVCKEISESPQRSKLNFINLKNWSELYDLYNKMHIMVLPAKFSNGNFTILESMAAGCGIIISENVLGIGNEIINNVNGYVCKLDINTFYEKIKLLIKDPNLLKKHSIINKEKVQKYSPENVSNMLMDILKDG